MNVESRGVVFDASLAIPEERVAFFGGLTVLRSGTILVLAQVGSDKHALNSTLVLFRSVDGGLSWKRIPFRFVTALEGVPGSFGSGQVVEIHPGRLLLIATWYDRHDPSRPLFDPVTEGLLSSRQLKAFSSDEGETWTPWQTITIPAALAGCSSTGPIVRWQDGTIAFPFESLKAYRDTQPAVPAAWCLLSKDGGESFGEPLLVARDSANKIYYWDQRWCSGLSGHEFVAMFWTHDVASKRDVPIHLIRADADGLGSGGSSLTPSDTGLIGQIAAPLLLEDGRLFAFVVERGPPGRLVLWCSTDRASEWSDSLVIYDHDERATLSQGSTNINYAEYWDDMHRWTFGHPALRRVGDNELILSFYAGVPKQLSLRWARVRI